jgi:DNA polymerase delta subunit 1
MNSLSSTKRKHHLPPFQEPKRLRGGGFDNDYNDDGPPEDFFPDAEDEMETHYNDQTDSAIHYAQLSSSQLSRWARKPLPTNLSTTNQQDIHFQWLDIDMSANNTPLTKNPNSKRKQVLGAQEGQVPIIRVYGVTDGGHSIVTILHGYTPYGYFALPEGYTLDCQTEGQNVALGKIRLRLNDLLRQTKSNMNRGGHGGGGGDLVQGVEYVEDKTSIMGYDSSHTKFLKVYLQMPNLVPTLKRIMEEGVSLPHIVKKGGGSAYDSNQADNVWDENGGGSSGQSYQPFECNVPFVLRFMIDEDLNGAGWITLPKGTYQLRTEENGRKCSHCQV